jgi:glycosyltransferase involved in cell wall biosynthesis
VTAPVGIVVIGRNEGERLVRCLESLRGQGRVVYVDSGSTDGSVERARELGAEVVELDMTRPFTAARARNAGFLRLQELELAFAFVQFVDGDCELRDGWIPTAATALSANPGTAAVCGRLRERHPERSVWNRLCDMEWDGPVGEISACGGVAMYRAEVFRSLGGFEEEIQAGEEPELCLRIRLAGWRVQRIGAEMALHDAAMTSVWEWVTRAKRAGQAYAHCQWMHRAVAFRRRQVMRAVMWGVLWPVALVSALVGVWSSWWFAVAAAALLLLGGASVLRIARRRKLQGASVADALVYATAITLVKPAEAMGIVRFHFWRLRGLAPKLLEYRKAAHGA